MVELVWSTLQTQCLNRRIPDAATLRSEVAAWEAEPVGWMSRSTGNSQTRTLETKLHRLYPTIEGRPRTESLNGWEGTKTTLDESVNLSSRLRERKLVIFRVSTEFQIMEVQP